MLLTAAALVIVFTRVVVSRHTNVSLGYEIAQATNEQRRLEEELKKLRIDRAALLDPARLEPVAVKHGYRVPTPAEVVAVHETPAAPASEGSHGAR
jgi:cell division protein FtsL